jgi:hypothetical protein
MLQLADTQALIHRGLLTGEISGLVPMLTGGRYPERRFAIHQRNYETTLVNALVSKFPATAWLIGATFLAEAAKRFVHECPPQAPCIAEYGKEFRTFLTKTPGSPGAGRLPYLSDFAELEWHIGQITIAVQEPPLSADGFANIPPAALPDAHLTLQPGVRYLRVSWPVDELMKIYLTDTASEQFAIESAELGLELRGGRGEFRIERLDPAEFAFRKSIAQGASIGDAAEQALDADAAFNPGEALAGLIASGLVIGIA